MNLYARLANLKADRGVTGTSDDAVALRMLGSASRAVDDVANRHFYSQIATQYYDGGGKSQLWLRDDLLSITSLAVDNNGDGVYETALVQDTDYWLYPDNSSPKLRLDLIPSSNKLSVFRNARRSVKITGLFGFSNDSELTGATINMNPAGLSAVATLLTVSDGTQVSVGETLVLESEQVYVSAVAVNDLTLVRGVNGTTAAAHGHGLAVYRRRYPEPIERAVVMQSVRFLREQQTGNSGVQGEGQLGGFAFSSMFPAIRDLVAPYVRPAIG